MEILFWFVLSSLSLFGLGKAVKKKMRGEVPAYKVFAKNTYEGRRVRKTW